ncbi:hypothetical protein GZ77_25330 [Endozoicomonas montiporae]|uniref:Peptidase S1 domain-containing protein n=2 Tax=Endozoicomonas montiporae TaxID=1027273 RepID=A0A081MZ06_9GAMM|nr:hypothetical protein GZ77_25330 [Endozoicomonas montiporae]
MDTYPEIAFFEKETRYGRSSCTATLIDVRTTEPKLAWFLTAAHCAYAGEEKNIKLSMRNYHDRHMDNIPVARVYQYEGWKIGGYEKLSGIMINDASLLEVQLPEGLERIKPMRLTYRDVSDDDIEKGDYADATAAGYGLTGDESRGQLNKVIAPAMTKRRCWGENIVFAPLFKSILCGGKFTNGGKGAFYGDSGSPYFITENGVRKQIGLVSYGSFSETFSQNNLQRELYNITYCARIEFLKDFIVSHVGTGKNRLFSWGKGSEGAARVFKQGSKPLGICKPASSSQVCTLDISSSECICPTEDQILTITNANHFEALQGNLLKLYRWHDWDGNIGKHFIFSTNSRDNQQEMIGSTGSPVSDPVPCLVNLSDERKQPTGSVFNATEILPSGRNLTSPVPAYRPLSSFIGTLDENNQCLVRLNENQVVASTQFKILVHYTYQDPTTTTTTVLDQLTMSSKPEQALSKGTIAGIAVGVVVSVVVVMTAIGGITIKKMKQRGGAGFSSQGVRNQAYASE